MASSRRAHRCLVLLVSLALLPLSMATDPIGGYCSESGTSDAEINGKARRRSINSVVFDLVAKAGPNGGFATSSAGKGNNTFYGLAQCRGDVAASDCDACLTEAAANQTLTFCHYASDSRMWYDYCFMRYKNDDFIGQVDTRLDASVTIRKDENMDDPKKFQRAVGKAMGKATAQAVAAGSAGLGRVKEKYTSFVSIYGLAQCTRDLAPLACAQCLSTAVSLFSNFCGAAQGCQIEYSSCWVHYETYPFYFPLVGAGGRVTANMTKYTKNAVP